MSLSAVKVSTATLWQIFFHLEEIALCLVVTLSLFELRAKLVQQANCLAFCCKCSSSQYLGLLEKLYTRQESWPVLPDTTSLSKSGCLWLLLAAVHQSEATLTAGFRGQKTITGQRFAVSAIVKICRNGHTGVRIRWYS